jgi:hypothetical protein
VYRSKHLISQDNIFIRRVHMVAGNSSSSEDELSLGVDQEKAPALTRDAASSSMVSQRRGSVPS